MSSVDVVEKLHSVAGYRTSKSVKIFLAEFLGTFILILFGNASVAQSVFSGANNVFSINWGYGLGVFFGVMVSGGVSGGHLNPAVTLGMALWGRVPWPKVPIYMVAQYLGSFAASGALFIIYCNALEAFESTPSLTTAGIWATYPGTVQNENGTLITGYLTALNGITDQVFGTMLLLICVCAIVDQRNMKVPSWMSGFFVAMAVLNIGICFGMNCGYAINPARDLSPRFFTMIAGWGNLPFTATTADGVPWWWIPIVAPHVGAVVGIAVYTLFIEMHHDMPESPVHLNRVAPANGKSMEVLRSPTSEDMEGKCTDTSFM